MRSVSRSVLAFLPVLVLPVLVLGFSVGATASAEAARAHHPKARHASVRYSHAAVQRYVVPPVVYDDTPSYNDPSKWGGGAP
jgi:hypothetical protein